MRKLMDAMLIFIFAAQLLGCACCPSPGPSIFGVLPNEKIEKALRDNPLGAKENFKITPLSRDANSSYHLVQLRIKERLHRHNTHAAKVMLWRGHGTLLLDGKPVALKEGDVFEIPKGAPHAFTNESDEPAVAVVQFTPQFGGKDTEYLDGNVTAP